MNAERRKIIAGIINKIRPLKDELDGPKDEEQDYFDNMPEGLQAAERGELAESAIDAMDEAQQMLEDAADKLEEIE